MVSSCRSHTYTPDTHTAPRRAHSHRSARDKSLSLRSALGVDRRDESDEPLVLHLTGEPGGAAPVSASIQPFEPSFLSSPPRRPGQRPTRATRQ